MKTSAYSILLFWLLSLTAHAFPPSPGFTLHGTVRDEYGWAVDAEDAVVRFRHATSGAVIAEGRISAGGQITENYRVALPLDHQRTGVPYRPGAAAADTAFSIEAVINGVLYFPIPLLTAAVPAAGAGEFYQLDLVLGEDSDGDGLPDLWEQWQLEAAGLDMAAIELITGSGDLDGDGASNLDEFIAGTFALLADDVLTLKFLSIGEQWSTLQFLAVVDKTYVLERSADMQSWETAPFGLWAERTELKSDWKAPDTVQQTIQTPQGATGQRWFYKLTVQ
jgi:hypothetical protein